MVEVAWRDNTVWDGRDVGSRESIRVLVDMAPGVVRKESSASRNRDTVDRRRTGSRATGYNPALSLSRVGTSIVMHVMFELYANNQLVV